MCVLSLILLFPSLVFWPLTSICFAATGREDASVTGTDWARFNPYNFKQSNRLVPSPALIPAKSAVYPKAPAFPHNPAQFTVIFGRGAKNLPTVIYAKAYDVLLLAGKYYQAPGVGESKTLSINGQSVTIYGTTVYTPLRANNLIANPLKVTPFDPSKIFYKQNDVYPAVIYGVAGSSISISGQQFTVPEAGHMVTLTFGADGREKSLVGSSNAKPSSSSAAAQPSNNQSSGEEKNPGDENAESRTTVSGENSGEGGTSSGASTSAMASAQENAISTSNTTNNTASTATANTVGILSQAKSQQAATQSVQQHAVSQEQAKPQQPVAQQPQQQAKLQTTTTPQPPQQQTVSQQQARAPQAVYPASPTTQPVQSNSTQQATAAPVAPQQLSLAKPNSSGSTTTQAILGAVGSGLQNGMQSFSSSTTSSENSKSSSPLTDEELASQAGPDVYHVLSVLLGRAFNDPTVSSKEDSQIQRDLKAMRRSQDYADCADTFEQCYGRIKAAMEHYKKLQTDRKNKEELEAGNEELQVASELLAKGAQCVRGKTTSTTAMDEEERATMEKAIADKYPAGPEVIVGNSGKKFSSPEEALKSWANDVYDISKQTHREYAAALYQESDTVWRYTPSLRGTPAQSDPQKAIDRYIPDSVGINKRGGTSNNHNLVDLHTHDGHATVGGGITPETYFNGKYQSDSDYAHADQLGRDGIMLSAQGVLTKWIHYDPSNPESGDTKVLPISLGK